MASKRIAGITGELILNVNKWSSGIKQVQKDSDALEKSLKPLTRAADTIGKPMLAAGAAISAALLGASKVAADYGDTLSEVSSKTGVTTQDLGKLKFAAEQNDTSFEGLSTGLKFLSKNLVEASTGGKEQARVFKALGIATKDAHGNVRPLNDVLLQSADVFKRLPDGPEKAAVAMKLFGKSGADLIPLLNQGSAGIKEFGDEAERLGLAIDPAAAALGDDFNNALNKSKNALLGFSVSIGNVLLPALTSAVNKGNEATVWASNFAREFPVATKAAAGLAGILTAGGGLIVGLGTLGTLAPKVAEGLRLIGGSATLAKAGLVGLTVGGILFLKTELDKLEESGLFQGGFWQDMRDGVISTLGPYALARSAIIQFRTAWEDLMGRSSSMDKALVGVNDKIRTYNQAQIDAAAATAYQGKETDKYSAELKKLLGDLTKTNTAVDEHANKIKQLREAFASSLKPADDLEKTLKLLGDTVSRKDVLAVYGDQIIEATAKQKDHGFQVSNNIALLNAMALGARAVNRELELQEAAIGQVLSGPGQRTVGMERADIGDILPETNTESRLENLIKFEKDMARESNRRAEDFQTAWERSMRNVSERTSDAFADMVVSGKFEFGKLTNIAKDTARDMLSAFTKGLLSPFTDALGNLGRKAATSIAGALFGGSGGQQGGNAGGLLNIGGMLGGLFGGNKGGGTANAGTPPFAGGSGLLGNAFGQLQGIGNPIQMGLSIANGAVDLLNKTIGQIGKGRQAADQIVKQENAFTASVKSLLEDKTLSTASKSKIFENTLSGLQSSSAIFGATDPNNQKVVGQMFANLAPFIQNVRAGFERDMPTIGAGGSGQTTITGPLLSLEVNIDGSGLTAIEIRDTVIPEITKVLETGGRGVLEKWAQLLNVSTSSTFAPVGI